MLWINLLGNVTHLLLVIYYNYIGGFMLKKILFITCIVAMSAPITAQLKEILQSEYTGKTDIPYYDLKKLADHTEKYFPKLLQLIEVKGTENTVFKTKNDMCLWFMWLLVNKGDYDFVARLVLRIHDLMKCMDTVLHQYHGISVAGIMAKLETILKKHNCQTGYYDHLTEYYTQRKSVDALLASSAE